MDRLDGEQKLDQSATNQAHTVKLKPEGVEKLHVVAEMAQVGITNGCFADRPLWLDYMVLLPSLSSWERPRCRVELRRLQRKMWRRITWLRG